MLDTRLVADTFNHEFQCRSSAESAEVLASLAQRIAETITDPREREAFVDVATMSGLEVFA